MKIYITRGVSFRSIEEGPAFKENSLKA